MMQLPETQFLCATIGLPGSGKSTAALEYIQAHPMACMRVNRDTLRSMQDPTKWSGKFEATMRAQRDILIGQALSKGQSVICDDTNLNPKTIDMLRHLAKSANVEFVIRDEFLQVSVEECIRRDVQRKEGRCGKDVIEKMYFDYWATQEKPKNEGESVAVMCDLDGTLAIIPPGAGPYERDWSGDILNVPVQDVLAGCRALGMSILIVSGRDGRFEDATRKWLNDQHVSFDALYMRSRYDYRPDTVVKRELYLNRIQGQWEIAYVLDDRPSVVRMWRAELGLTVFQVAPNLEF